MKASITVLTMALIPSLGLAQSDPSSGTISVVDYAPYLSPYIGIAGSSGTTAACPPGKLVVGIGGTKIKFVQKITPLCGQVNKDGSFASVSPLDPGAIAPNASGFSLRCGSGKVVSGIGVSYHPNTTTYPYLGGVEIECKPWLLSQWSDPAAYTRSSAFDNWSEKARVSCTRQVQPARSLRIRATTSVKQISVVCDEI